MSPTVLRSGPYRFFFFASDRHEPPHVHVKQDDKLTKFCLTPVHEAYNYGFSSTELKRIATIVQKNETDLLKAWHDYFDRTNRNSGGKKSTSH